MVPFGSKVLVVEDDESARAMLVMTLEQAGYRVQAACDGLEAAARLKLETYDLVITDYQMPRLDGLKLLSLCQAAWPDTPVVLLSGSEEASHACQCGAYAWLRKPYAIAKVLEIAAGAIHRAADLRGHPQLAHPS